MGALVNAGPIVRPSELEGEPARPACHIGGGWHIQKGITVVVAESGAGKTALGFYMAYCMGRRRLFFGQEAEAKGMLYVVGEGFPGVPGRLQALCSYHGAELRDLDPVMGILPVPLDISGSEMVERVRAHAEQIGLHIDVLFIDTLSSNAPAGFNESDNAHMKALMDCVRELRDRYGWSVILFHHTGNANGAAGARARGAYDLTASADTVLFISREGNTRTVKMTKSRDFAPIEPVQFTLEPFDNSVVVVPVEGVRGINPQTGEMLPSARNALATLVESGMGAPLSNQRWFILSGLQRTAYYAAKKSLLAGGYVLQDAKGYVPTNKADQLLRLTENSSRTVSRTPPSSSSAPPYKGGGANELNTDVRGVRNELRANQREDGPGLQEYRWDLLEAGP
ncbi:MAG: AAA family ATPase [Gemmatimonas sp.]|nr:AAA family ATPase [Gemmatimonas sp.]